MKSSIERACFIHGYIENSGMILPIEIALKCKGPHLITTTTDLAFIAGSTTAGFDKTDSNSTSWHISLLIFGSSLN
jgi:hypothetical protein